jgi:hypothetical protein
MHVFGKPNGKGNEIVAINRDGTGHDGFSKSPVPTRVADLARAMGYAVPLSNLLESVDLNAEAREFEEFIIVVERHEEASS